MKRESEAPTRFHGGAAENLFRHRIEDDDALLFVDGDDRFHRRTDDRHHACLVQGRLAARPARRYRSAAAFAGYQESHGAEQACCRNAGDQHRGFCQFVPGSQIASARRVGQRDRYTADAQGIGFTDDRRRLHQVVICRGGRIKQRGMGSAKYLQVNAPLPGEGVIEYTAGVQRRYQQPLDTRAARLWRRRQSGVRIHRKIDVKTRVGVRADIAERRCVRVERACPCIDTRAATPYGSRER